MPEQKIMKKNSSPNFLIVTYQPPQTFTKLLRTLSRFTVLTVDNSENKNLGYAGAINVGVKKLLKQAGEWVIILNQDIVLSINTLEQLEQHLYKTRADLLGPFTGTIDPIRYSTIFPVSKITEPKLSYLSGSFIAIRKNVFSKIGFWEEKYFLYYEDVDFCQKALKRNLLLEKIELRDIYHEENSSLGKNSFLHQYYLARNHLLFVEKHAPLIIRFCELFRLPKTIWDHQQKQESGALYGVKDYLLRKFGKYEQFRSIDF